MPKRNPCADPCPESLDPTDYFYRQLEVDGKQIGIRSYRMLLSKLLYTDLEFTEADEINLFLSYEKVVELCADDLFHRSYFFQIFLNRLIFVNLSYFVQNKELILRHREMLGSFYSHRRQFLSASIYFGTNCNLRIPKMVSRQPAHVKEKNRIGVGYRDKGNARNPSLDGSPAWEEVATDERFRTLISNSKIVRIERLWLCLMQNVGRNYWYLRTTGVTSKLCQQMKG